MRYDISSGNGPAECELAVTKLTQYLAQAYGATVIKVSPRYNNGTFRTAAVDCDSDLSAFVGSILWICKSPYRPGHKRKNWFISFVRSDGVYKRCFNPALVEFTTCHSRGNGGQNVNKVETGVRAFYPPTNDVALSFDERSQYANKKKAIERLQSIIERRNAQASAVQANAMRISHVNLERGNAVAVFTGMGFIRSK